MGVVADSLGRFALAPVVPGKYQLEVRALGYDAQSSTVVVRQGHVVTTHITLKRLRRSLRSILLQ
jgi:hypothetical protein